MAKLSITREVYCPLCHDEAETAMSWHSQITLPDVDAHRRFTLRGTPIRSTC